MQPTYEIKLIRASRVSIFRCHQKLPNKIQIHYEKWYIYGAILVKMLFSIKNESVKRDLEMDQTNKVNNWYFGMKNHADIGAGTDKTHSLKTMIANVHGIGGISKLIRRRGNEVVYNNIGYLGQTSIQKLWKTSINVYLLCIILTSGQEMLHSKMSRA